MNMMSIYIPRISNEYNESCIRYVMMQNNIGTVNCVDFTPINKNPGFTEKINGNFRSAFVHFSDPVSFNGTYLYDDNSVSDFWDEIEKGKSYKIQVNNNEYWICLKNKNPVQRSMMNIHQVVENGRYLEKLIHSQTAILEKHSRLIETQRELINSQYSIIKQLKNKIEKLEYKVEEQNISLFI